MTTMEHELKLSSVWFDDVESGRKTFEVRRDDRAGGFRIGDRLRLREYDGRSYTGRQTCRSVVYVLRALDAPGIEVGYAVLGLGAP